MKKIPNPNKMKKIRGPKLAAAEMAQVKVRITTYLDEDILQSLKSLAKDSAGKYQTLLNQLLRESLFGKSEGVLARLKRLEQAVFP